MYLKELEIFGFKSFPEKTTLKFEPGITVIVGPNGCGKSNVLDAIKWSLGEQSAKSLRGTKMEDIIFNGTEKHPPLNYAEVTMIFSNENGYLPIEYKEVAVGRRLYRSGESQYFINRNPVRLKDVQDLFMGTGIGESTYSFVEQGKIDIFLSHKPEEKRVIFDEASGIVKYKERKRETMRRLKEADENLLRLDDILSELRRQIRYLERQVEKARKYKEAQEKLVDVEKRIAKLQFVDFETRAASISKELEQLAQEEKEAEGGLNGQRSNWQEFNQKLRVLRKDLEETNASVASLSAGIQSSQAHIQMHKQRIVELEERKVAIEQMTVTLRERLSAQTQRVQEEKKQFEVIDEAVQSLDTEVNQFRQEKETITAEIESSKKKITEEKTRIFELESRKTQSHNALIEIQTNVTTFLKRKQRLFLDKARIEGLIKEKKERLSEAEELLGNAESRLNVLRERKSRLVSKEKELLSRKDEFRNKIIEKEKELVELTSYYEFLKDLKVKYDVFPTKKTVTIVLNEAPADINKLVMSLKDVQFVEENGIYKAEIEAKVISLDEKDLEDKITIVNADIEKLKNNIEVIDGELKKLAEEVGSQAGQLEEEERKLNEKLQEKENLHREWARFNEEFELVQQELDGALKNIENLEAEQKEKEEENTFYEQNLNAAQSSMHTAQGVIDRGFERTKEIDIEMARREAQKESLHKEREGLNSKLVLLEEERNNISNNITSIENEKQDNSQKVISLNQEIENLNTNIQENQSSVSGLTTKKQELEQLEVSLDQDIEGVRQKIQQWEEKVESVRSKVYSTKLSMQNLDHEKGKVKDYMLQVYNVEFDPQSTSLAEGDSLDGLGVEKEKLVKRKQSLGEVNLIAIEEFEELKAREESMVKQKDDLITSKDNLKKAISKINRTSKELFLETFAKIEEEFKKNYRFLFNGGRARLVLLEPDNVLESGVEIEVQPPGKKLQNVSLLSGGEKALTAIALIFAIFRVRPSPLCVLDEIDAPLDEANVDRFNHILKEFASFSQFMMITHNKRTMSNADVLYGVTMQEKGVSKLVSVKFADDQPVTQAAQ